MKLQKTYSPLFVWKLVLIIVILGAGVLASIDPIRMELAQRRAALPKKQPRIKPAENATRVLFFGDSRLRYALPPYEKSIAETLTRIASDRGQLRNPIEVINLTRDGRSAWELEGRADQILALHPAVIVVQAEMIIDRKRTQPRRPEEESFVAEVLVRLQNWAQFLKAPLMKEIGGNERSQKNVEQLRNALSSQAQIDIQLLKKPEERLDENLEEARGLLSGQIVSTSSQPYIRSRAFLKRAREKGVLVIVLETPASQRAVELATGNYLRQRATAVKKLLESDSDHYLRFPTVLEDKYFLDYRHLNEEGRKIFFQWLAPVLMDHMIQEKVTTNSKEANNG